MKINEIIEIIRELEINYIEDNANSYWKELDHTIKIDFLCSFISEYFKFNTIYNIYDQPETYDMFKPPVFYELEEKEQMIIVYEETKIILNLILQKKLTGENIKNELIQTRCPGFDNNFNNMINNYPALITFLSKSYNIDYIKEQNAEILAKVNTLETMLNRMQYYIFSAYNRITLKKDYSTIAKLYNKKYLESDIDSDINTTEVKKFTNDIKQLFEDIEKKDNMVSAATLKKHLY